MHQRDYISQLLQEQLGFDLEELKGVSEGNMPRLGLRLGSPRRTKTTKWVYIVQQPSFESLDAA